MKSSNVQHLDIVLEPDDNIEVRTYLAVSGVNLAVDINGVTVLRVARLPRVIDIIHEP